MSFDLTDRSLLVTGASSGIGAEVAIQAARRGARVGLCARREPELRVVLDECRRFQPDSAMWTVDLADPDQVDRLAREAEQALDGVDVLVNNAGIPKRRHVTALSVEELESVTRINYLAPTTLALRLLPGMLARGEGRIVNVASVAAMLSSPGESAYSASKAALTVWSETASVDLAETGVRVHVIHPGVVDTPLFQVPGNDDHPNPIDPIPSSEAAAAVLRPLETDELVTYVPEYFADIARSKAADPQTFLVGVADWVKDNRT